MNTLGLTLIMKMGCFCTRETININGTKYTVKEHLGEGGFSTIDLVQNVHTKKLYALKKITCHSIEDQKIALQEIDYYKKLKHPNLIELIDSTFKGSADIVVNVTSVVYMVLPYLKKGSLHDYLGLKSLSKDHVNVKEVLRIFNQICEGVKFIHEAKPEPLAHRDIKTANICFTESFSPVLMDFGSMAPARVQVCGSTDAQRLQDIAAERCSMPYRAPELFNVESYCVIDERTDIWSLGCLLYALCFFKSPFDIVYERGDSVALAVLSGNIPFPEDSPYSQDVIDLIRYILRINPSERPFIYTVMEKTQFLRNKLDHVV
ncbi:serine/threonine-protein kinase 16 [Onthophagus taurus]|uniref:serine/threonine-protein kinase 16 n=1 Tax=Onthophagus taurus TaxID=166361 RepID=UPI000C20F105|nr:serine/threonine-protein kinase 16 [Onthophagus taurus]XP_022908830.1 serine/threonine-protein kinase 16 [Onthophagus taurus]XP_022908832.1 serine/threonine-protein kinase 16 [Onthophagus taurus]